MAVLPRRIGKLVLNQLQRTFINLSRDLTTAYDYMVIAGLTKEEIAGYKTQYEAVRTEYRRIQLLVQTQINELMKP